VTTVSPVSGTSTTDTTSSTNPLGKLDANAFLQLLIAQLKNQDPTKPMDSTQFVSQLATFTQVQESVTTNSKLDSLLTASALTLGDAAIGHTVTSADGTTSGVVTSVKITSDGPVATLDNGDTLTLGDGVTIQ
jgi:flagellar basal-body rod modification protein FlgD